MFVYKPTFNVLELKNNKGINVLLAGNQRNYIILNLKQLHGTFLPNLKYFVNKIGIQFNNTSLGIEQNIYATN